MPAITSRPEGLRYQIFHTCIDLSPYITPDLVPDLLPYLASDVLAYLILDLTPDLLPDSVADLSPDLVSDMLPGQQNLLPDVVTGTLYQCLSLGGVKAAHRGKGGWSAGRTSPHI
jgi:hypothetical protein